MNDFNQSAAEALAKMAALEHRSVVRRSESTSLTPTQLAERAIIPYLDGANRALVDSFRDLRTRLLAISNENFITLVVPVSAISRCR